MISLEEFRRRREQQEYEEYLAWEKEWERQNRPYTSHEKYLICSLVAFAFVVLIALSIHKFFAS